MSVCKPDWKGVSPLHSIPGFTMFERLEYSRGGYIEQYSLLYCRSLCSPFTLPPDTFYCLLHYKEVAVLSLKLSQLKMKLFAILALLSLSAAAFSTERILSDGSKKRSSNTVECPVSSFSWWFTGFALLIAPQVGGASAGVYGPINAWVPGECGWLCVGKNFEDGKPCQWQGSNNFCVSEAPHYCR